MSCLTALACNKPDPVELLVTQDRCNDLFTTTRLKVPCFHQDSNRLAKAIGYTYITFGKRSLFQLINISDFNQRLKVRVNILDVLPDKTFRYSSDWHFHLEKFISTWKRFEKTKQNKKNTTIQMFVV